MKIEINIEKKHLYLLALMIALVGIGIVIATAPNPGHSWSEIGDFPGTIWHSNNDGFGSGLDADLLDGHDTNYFQKDIGSNCSANQYVYGVRDDGVLLCRDDQTGSSNGLVLGGGTVETSYPGSCSSWGQSHCDAGDNLICDQGIRRELYNFWNGDGSNIGYLCIT
ncbi:hypothetical protein D6745_00340 [Candidatus Woesearchaeota archaeon]|nr:MAG: hypothetical protein D6745_00340 [Candidatus Woesearchaeota archaeon]